MSADIETAGFLTGLPFRFQKMRPGRCVSSWEPSTSVQGTETIAGQEPLTDVARHLEKLAELGGTVKTTEMVIGLI
jgi:hypothetical protein